MLYLLPCPPLKPVHTPGNSFSSPHSDMQLSPPRHPVISTLSLLQLLDLQFLFLDLTGQNISLPTKAHFCPWQEGFRPVVGIGRIGFTEQGTPFRSPPPPLTMPLCTHTLSFTNPHTHTHRCLPVRTSTYSPLNTHKHSPTVSLPCRCVPTHSNMEREEMSSSASSYPQADGVGGGAVKNRLLECLKELTLVYSINIIQF